MKKGTCYTRERERLAKPNNIQLNKDRIVRENKRIMITAKQPTKKNELGHRLEGVWAEETGMQNITL